MGIASNGSRPAAGGVTVELRNVSKRYGNQAGAGGVTDVSLRVAPGEICVLVGPSGCGKTTTLKMVNRLVEPDSGEVLIDGENVLDRDVVALRRNIGYVIQQVGLFPHQSIAANVATVPRLLKWDRDRIRERVDALIALVGLDPDKVRDRYPSQLSGGERQRIGVARAMAAEPPVMLMDEPFGAVDPVVRSRLQDEFLRLQDQVGTTVLFVTHDIDEAIKMGTHVAVFAPDGTVAQYSTPGELLSSPADDYVASFVGADRAIKRLAVMTIDEVDLEAIADSGEGPELPDSMAVREALAILLTTRGQSARVTDADGAYRGVLTIAAVGDALRDGYEADIPAAPPGDGSPLAGAAS